LIRAADEKRPAHLPRHTPVKSRSINDNGQRRPLLIRCANQSPIEPKNLRQAAKNLSDANDRKILSIDNNLASGSPHAFPARAKELRRDSRPRLSSGAKLRSPPQRINQLRAIHFARSFTGRDQDTHGSHCNGAGGTAFSRRHSP
jgi:hypothetical protein